MRIRTLSGILAMTFAMNASGGTEAGCRGGLILETTVDGDLTVTGGECTVISSTITGDVSIVDGDYVVMVDNEIRGGVRFSRSGGTQAGGAVSLIENKVMGGSLIVSDYAIANVIGNETRTGSISVVSNAQALVEKNISSHNLLCMDNDKLSIDSNFAKKTLSCD